MQHLLQSALIIEFSLLLLLGVFGAHRLLLVIYYLRLRHKPPTGNAPLARLPRVTIQIPLYNEWETARRSLEQVALISYPQALLEIQILDDSSNADCQKIAIEAAENLLRQGFNVHYLHRKHRNGYKAGALAEGLNRARGEFVAIFDADFQPTTDFLEVTLPYFSDPQIAMVQCRWSHLNYNSSYLTRAQATLLDGHFQIEHTVRSRLGLFFNFNGTAGIWRKAAIESAGGWQGDTLTEDLDLSYRAQLAGAQFVYLLQHPVPAELPETLQAFQAQQHRWTKGAIEVFLKLAPEILRAKTTVHQKIEAFFHLAANFCYPLLLLAGLLLLPTLFAELPTQPVATYQTHILFSIGFASVALFYWVSARESRTASRFSTFVDVVLALVVGIGLSLPNTIAVFEALARNKTPFMRTPKVGNRDSAVLQTGQSTLAKQKLRLLVTGLNVSLVFYFFATLVKALHVERYSAVVFSLLFLASFLIASWESIANLTSSPKTAQKRKLRPALER